ncbi:MAG: hypothetical protein VX762_06020 [Bacteroidota bacterium]|nr:hypothetical protein [Bacteroidota bacterium]
MKKLLQAFYLSITVCLLFSGCSKSLYTSNAARDQRPLLFENEYDIKELSDIQSTGEAFWGIPISQKKYKRKNGMILYFNGVALTKTPKILPILTLLSLDYFFTTSVMQPIFGEKKDTYESTEWNGSEYVTVSNSYSTGDKRLGLVPGLLLSLPIAGTINNFIWSGATAEASSTIERQLIEENPDVDLFFFPKYEVKKYNVFNDGPRYLWWQKADVDAKVKGATIKLTK